MIQYQASKEPDQTSKTSKQKPLYRLSMAVFLLLHMAFFYIILFLAPFTIQDQTNCDRSEIVQMEYIGHYFYAKSLNQVTGL